MYHRRLVPTGPTWSAVQLEAIIMAKRSKHVEMAEEPKGPVEAPASTEAPAGTSFDAKTGRVEAYAPGTFNASTRRPQKA